MEKVMTGAKSTIVIDFLTEERDCTLVTNEMDRSSVFMLAYRRNIRTKNLKGKAIRIPLADEPIHYIEYRQTHENEEGKQ